ncbi:MAG TPA: hypothetical protein VMU50_12420, partial [Polyangia bacterium]|nr:hypothetical protein [Polyangia bacterium]
RQPKFGAHCLVDLLAAREEAERGADRDRSLAPPGLGLMARGVRREPLFDTRRVDDISALLVRRAPFPGADAGRLLVEAGLSGRALSLREIAAGYRSLMLPLPIRIARHGGVDVAVPAGTVGVATTVIATAVRFVADWGLATVESISDRVRALRTTSVAREIAARVVVALPSFLWIDEANGWFTLRGVRSRLATTVRQVFAVATRIRFDDLARALTKRKTRLPALPPPALDNYLRAVCDCEIVDGWVHAGAIEAAVPLSAEEKRVADALARARLAPSARRRDAEPALAASALRALLGDAPPLLPAAPGRARLVAIGASASP